jgi:hypothetical protein
MAAVVIVLSQVNGLSLASWSFPIQPNSLVSVFITLSKSALMAAVGGVISQSKWMQFSKPTPIIQLWKFDDASRGPWGSLDLLLDLRKGFKLTNVLAVLGALLTIIALALDPFTQQIIAYPSRLVVHQSDATVAAFNTTQIFIDLDSIALQGAVLSGIYQNPQITNYDCTTSDCRWSTLESLGVCSACKDLTAQVKVSCSTTPGPLQPTNNDTWIFESTDCNYTVTDNIT